MTDLGPFFWLRGPMFSFFGWDPGVDIRARYKREVLWESNRYTNTRGLVVFGIVIIVSRGRIQPLLRKLS